MLCTQPYLSCRASPKSQLCLPPNTGVSYAELLNSQCSIGMSPSFVYVCMYMFVCNISMCVYQVVCVLQERLKHCFFSVRDHLRTLLIAVLNLESTKWLRFGDNMHCCCFWSARGSEICSKWKRTFMVFSRFSGFHCLAVLPNERAVEFVRCKVESLACLAPAMQQLSVPAQKVT